MDPGPPRTLHSKQKLGDRNVCARLRLYFKSQMEFHASFFLPWNLTLTWAPWSNSQWCGSKAVPFLLSFFCFLISINAFLIMAAKMVPSLDFIESSSLFFILYLYCFWTASASIMSLHCKLTHFCEALTELFGILWRVFHRAKVLNFDEAQMINLFLLWLMLLVLCSRTLLQP